MLVNATTKRIYPNVERWNVYNRIENALKNNEKVGEGLKGSWKGLTWWHENDKTAEERIDIKYFPRMSQIQHFNVQMPTFPLAVWQIESYSKILFSHIIEPFELFLYRYRYVCIYELV